MKIHLKALFQLSLLCLGLVTLDFILKKICFSLLDISKLNLSHLGWIRGIELGLGSLILWKWSLKSYGLNNLKQLKKGISIGLLFAIAGPLLFYILEWILGPSFRTALVGTPPENALLPDDLLSVLLVQCCVGPFVEEFFFRGIMFEITRKARCSLKTQIVYDTILTFLFVLPHLLQTEPTAPLFALIICAVFNLRLYAFTQSIWAGFLVHASANASLYFIALGY